MTPRNPAVLLLRPEQWPQADQAAWACATKRRRGPWRKNGGGRACSPFTLQMRASSYGRWLGYLSQHASLEGASPAERVTPDRLDAYFEHLQACGNAGVTIANRFLGLQAALRMICPDGDFRWITRPGGISWRNQLDMFPRRARFVPSGSVVLAWAEEVFQAGLAARKPRVRRAQVRDAVIIAILATRAPRLRALSSLQTSVHLTKRGDEWLLKQTSDITKDRDTLTMSLSSEVAVMLERYLAVERRELLGHATHDWLWVGRGEKLASGTISRKCRRLTAARFGVAFGPHHFRRILATTNALDSPETPLDSSIILGHANPAVTLQRYNLASGIAASRRHSRRIADLRQKGESLAARLWPDA